MEGLPATLLRVGSSVHCFLFFLALQEMSATLSRGWNLTRMYRQLWCETGPQLVSQNGGSKPAAEPGKAGAEQEVCLSLFCPRKALSPWESGTALRWFFGTRMSSTFLTAVC